MSLRPGPADPEPPPTPCPGLAGPCGAPVRARWQAPRPSTFGLGEIAGRWLEAHAALCPACLEAADVQAVRQRLEDLIEASGIPPRHRWPSWTSHVKARPQEPWLAFRARLDAAASEAETEGRPPPIGITSWNARQALAVRSWRPAPSSGARPPWLYLTGPVGSGKTTFAAAALLASLEDQARALELSGDAGRWSSWRVAWVASADLWEALRVEQARRGPRGILSSLATADVLVLDDLGTTEQVRPWHRDALEFLICSRYDQDRPTVITSNLRLDSTDQDEPTIANLYGERVVSRILDCLGGRRGAAPPGYLELVGVDWRADVPHGPAHVDRAPSPVVTPTAPDPQLDWIAGSARA